MRMRVNGAYLYSNVEELVELGALASHVIPPLCIVEIGVFQGGSLRCMAQTKREEVHLFGVDTWSLRSDYEINARYVDDDMKIASEQIAPYDNCKLIRGFSVDVARDWTGPNIGLLYIDAEHTYSAIIADFGSWQHHLVDGAIVCFDDYNHKHHEVMDAVDDLARSGKINILRIVGGRLAVAEVKREAE